jgi:hypothetical protein
MSRAPACVDMCRPSAISATEPNQTPPTISAAIIAVQTVMTAQVFRSLRSCASPKNTWEWRKSSIKWECIARSELADAHINSEMNGSTPVGVKFRHWSDVRCTTALPRESGLHRDLVMSQMCPITDIESTGRSPCGWLANVVRGSSWERQSPAHGRFGPWIGGNDLR